MPVPGAGSLPGPREDHALTAWPQDLVLCLKEWGGGHELSEQRSSWKEPEGRTVAACGWRPGHGQQGWEDST